MLSKVIEREFEIRGPSFAVFAANHGYSASQLRAAVDGGSLSPQMRLALHETGVTLPSNKPAQRLAA